MRHIYTCLLFLVFFGGSCVVNAQGGCIIIANNQAFCTACSGNISSTGVISGTITVQASNFTLPTSCPESGALSIGALNLSLSSGAKLTVPDAVLVDGSAANTFTLNFAGSSNQANFIFRGTNFNRNQFAQAQSNVRAEGAAAPVTLLSWNAAPLKSDVQLSWSSIEEVDNDFYTVEHSQDGVHFVELTRLAGEASSDQILHYSYLHRAPGTGQHYYRLAQHDFDGTRTVFDIVSVHVGEQPAIGLFPNPASPGQQVQLSSVDTGTPISLYHPDGREVARFPAFDARAPYLTLPTTLLPGVYLLRSGTKSSRLVVR
ncbi:hypothetical protein LEM8419_00633 [Neolewinella maritima]|uniref:T9SS type A sorting domain-containing protein n=1 Tax=Neolewinella maritima TaxID=1383882 RepID=A0ABN8F0D6_9BACT|nr:hypothetical protein LEM8419_00633 [Neolewinella maritima]